MKKQPSSPIVRSQKSIEVDQWCFDSAAAAAAKQELVSHLGTYEIQKCKQHTNQECAKEEFTHHTDSEANSRN